MQTFNIHAAKTHLSRLTDEAAAGEDIVIARAGKPVAGLLPLTALPEKPRRILGMMAGRIRVSEDFNAPLPDQILDAFKGR